MILEFAFWFLVAVILYSYFGYALVLYVITRFKTPTTYSNTDNYPNVTLFIAAYNEKEFIDAKLKNCFELNYPANKLTLLWVTDGSNDGSNQILEQNPNLTVLHTPQRKGKIGAMNRGMQFVNTPIVVFCDANTMLNPQAINEIVKYFSDSGVGCVAGEKQIIKTIADKAVGAGESIYWKYESKIKEWESLIGSTIGAAGELFAIRTELYTPVEPDTLLDDFVISLRIAQKGYKVKYAPKAIACETSSATIKDELKRKIRIAVGGIQTLIRMRSLLNIGKYGLLSFKFWSHKVLRWTLVPFAMIALFFLNIHIVCEKQFNFYNFTLCFQIIFYLMAIIGLYYKNKQTKLKFLFAPYYLVIMNYAIIIGIIRYFKGSQTVNWEKAKRA